MRFNVEVHSKSKISKYQSQKRTCIPSYHMFNEEVLEGLCVGKGVCVGSSRLIKVGIGINSFSNREQSVSPNNRNKQVLEGVFSGSGCTGSRRQGGGAGGGSSYDSRREQPISPNTGPSRKVLSAYMVVASVAVA